MLSCKEVSRLVSDSLDHKLSLWSRLQVRLHLMMCSFCSHFRRQVLFLRSAVRDYPTLDEVTKIPASDGLSPDARERIKQRLTTNVI